MDEIFVGLCLGVLAGWLIVADLVLVAALVWLALRMVRKAAERVYRMTED